MGEAAKGEQSIANQGQEWMDIRATIKKAGSPSKKVGNTRGIGKQGRNGTMGSKGRVDASHNRVYICAVTCYLPITTFSV